MYEIFSQYLLYFAMAFVTVVAIVSIVLVYRSKQDYKFIKYLNILMVLIATCLVVYESYRETVPAYTALLLIIIAALLPGYSMYDRPSSNGSSSNNDSKH